jgi:competence ComEA-like helix-hairpin-helix protein
MALWDSLQRHLGLNRREAVAVVALTGLLALGAVYRWLASPEPLLLPPHLEELLDSLATAQYIALAQTAPQPASDTIPQRSSGQTKRELAPAAVNLNTATKAELMSLPGIGEVIAERILEYRRQKRFERPEELMEVKGIGPKKFERIRPYIRVE